MKAEYDFKQGQRGKFFREDAVVDLPIYLDPKVRDYLTVRARAKGMDLGKLVNELLMRDIELIEIAK